MLKYLFCKYFKFVLFSTILEYSLLSGGTPSIIDTLTNRGSPRLVLLGPNPDLRGPLAEFAYLLDSDESIDLNMVGHVIVENQELGYATGVLVRRHYGLPSQDQAPICWLLVGRMGEGCVSGTQLPRPRDWLAILEKAGFQSQVKQLVRFLKRHPDHLEARYDLVASLLPRLDRRLKKLPTAPTVDLDAATDARTWGPIAEAMEPLLKEGTIGLFSFALRLPKGCPEAHSPIMRDLYRQTRHIIQDRVVSFPEGRSSWEMLLRMNEAIGGTPELGPLLEIPLFASPYHRPDGVDLWCRIGESVARDARRTGGWKRALPLLWQLWEWGVRPELTFSWVTAVGNGSTRRLPTITELDTIARSDRERAWSGVLRPLVEGLVRTGSAGEVPALLASLDSSWPSIGLAEQLRALSTTLERPDIWPDWKSALTRLRPKPPIAGMFLGDLRLFHQNLPEPIEEGKIQTILGKLGLSLSVQPVPESWRRHLGWEPGRSCWALLDSHGKVRSKGAALPPAASFPDMLRQADCQFPLEMLREFRRLHPEQVFPLFLEVAKSQLMAETHWWERRSRQGPLGTTSPLSLEEKRAWQEYFEAFDRLLDHPLGLNAQAMSRTIRPNHCFALSPSELNTEEREIVDRWLSLGRKHAARLEKEVSQRPSEEGLWELLLSFQPKVPADLSGFFQLVEPSPLRKGTWPSIGLRGRIGEALIQQARWKEAVQVLEPGWQLISKSSVSPRTSDWNLFESLVLGYVQIGQWSDADAVITFCIDRGVEEGDIARMLLKVRSWGYRSWSDSWITKAREKQLR